MLQAISWRYDIITERNRFLCDIGFQVTDLKKKMWKLYETGVFLFVTYVPNNREQKNSLVITIPPKEIFVNLRSQLEISLEYSCLVKKKYILLFFLLILRYPLCSSSISFLLWIATCVLSFQYAAFLLLIFLLEAIAGVLAYMYEAAVSTDLILSFISFLVKVSVSDKKIPDNFYKLLFISASRWISSKFK